MTTLPGKFHIRADLIVHASASEVWKVIADFSAVDTWAPQVTTSYAIGEQDRGVGAQRHCDIKGFGSIQEEITEWIDGRSLTYRVTPLGPLGVSYNRWTVDEVSDSSCAVVVELGYNVRFGVIGRLMHASMMRRKLQQAFPKSLEALKARAETGELVRPRRSSPHAPQRVSAAA